MPQSLVKTVYFTYDNVGNLLNYDDGITSGTYVYDNENRKISETVDYGSFSKTYAYTYYGNGLKKTFTGPDGITYAYAYTYDANNQLTGIQIPGQVTITYNVENMPDSVSRRSIVTIFAYDGENKLVKKTARGPF